MFERLISSFGRPANNHIAGTPLDSELQLAASILLFGVLAVDFQISPEETKALQQNLQELLHLSAEKSHRLIARAAASVEKDSSIMSAATLLKHRSPEEFRKDLMKAMIRVICADGQVHLNELDRAARTARLLGLADLNLANSA